MSYSFNGSTLQTPATASYIDDSGMDAQTNAFGTVLALVGSARSTGATEGSVLSLTSYAQAQTLFNHSDDSLILKAIQKAFNPSPDTGGPEVIKFVNAQAPTTNIVDIPWLDSTANSTTNALILTQKLTGTAVKVDISNKAATATARGYQKIVLSQLDTNNNGLTVTVDKVFRDYFKLNKKTAATGTYTVTVAADKLTLAKTSPTASTKEFLFSTYITIASLIDAINTEINRKGTTLKPQVFNELVPINTAIAATKSLLQVNINGTGVIDLIPTAIIPAVLADPAAAAAKKWVVGAFITGNVQAVIESMNAARVKIGGQSLPIVSAKRAAAKTSYVGVDDNTATFSVSTNTSVNTRDWQTAIDLLKQEIVHWIVPLTEDDEVFAMINDHCTAMSNTMFRERRAIFGLTGDDKAAPDNAVAMDRERASMVHMGFYDTEKNDQNTLIIYPPYVLASLLAGMFCGVTPGTALTNKAINVSAMQRALLPPEDTDDLVAGGIIVCARNDKGIIKVLQSVSTSQSANVHKREVSVGVAADFVAKSIRDVLDPLRGQKKTPLLKNEVLSRAESELDRLAAPEPIGPGVLVGDNKNPPYKGLTVTEGLDWIQLDFECSPIIPANYIGIVIHTVPYNGSN